MKMTSAEANKVLRKLTEEHRTLRSRENEECSFVAATVENIEDARPDYSYSDTQEKLAEYEATIRKVKHAVNMFNVSQEVPGTGMTIDQILVYIPQLTERKRKLSILRSAQKKQRKDSYRGTNLIEYEYANYDIEKADADYQTVTDELAKIQNALDLVNSTVQFEVDM